MFPGFKSKNHPQQVAARGALADLDDRGTSPALFRLLDGRFGPFTIDVAASPANAKCDRFYTSRDNGLKQSWSGERVWCNPPFSDIRRWVEKAWRESPTAEQIVLPLPDPNDKRFTHHSRGRRTDKARREAYEKATRQRWRALALVIKAKLEAVESRISEFQVEFGMHFVMPDGTTFAQKAVPAIEQAYATGEMPKLLPAGY